MGVSATGIRAARAAVFTAVCVTLSAGAHVLLSGTPVPFLLLLAVASTVFPLAYALARRERGFLPIAALLVPLELAADTLFTTGQQTCYGASGGPVTGPLRSMGLDFVCSGGDFGTPLARVAGEASAAPLAHPWAPWLLLAGHVAVGLTAALWLRRGEAALARLLRAAAATTFRPLLLAVAVVRSAPAPGIPAAAAPWPPLAPRVLPLISHSVLRRGPPCPVAIAA